MAEHRPRFIESLAPYLIIGVAIALLVGILIMLSYVLVWGLLVGVVLWGIVRIKLFLTQKSSSTIQSGRIIEYEDHDKK